MTNTKQKTIKERARELLKKLEVHYKVKDKVHYRDLVGDKNLTLITKALQDTIKDTEERVIGEVEKVNRVEVIDHTKNVEDGGGRVYTKWEDELDVKLDIQDEGRTLKIFINKLKRK